MGDSETQVRLRKLAAKYVVQADEIESKESRGQHGMKEAAN